MLELDEHADTIYTVSLIELVAAVWEIESAVWLLETNLDPRLPVPQPTVAEQLRILRRTFVRFLKHFGMSGLQVYRFSGVNFRVGFPLDGLRLGIPGEVLVSAQRRLSDFAAWRFCRSIADLDRRF